MQRRSLYYITNNSIINNSYLYLFYLIKNNNYKNFIKLYSKNKFINLYDITLKSKPNGNKQGTYYYKISYYNIITT